MLELGMGRGSYDDAVACLGQRTVKGSVPFAVEDHPAPRRRLSVATVTPAMFLC
jgi:hypothetical protein